MNACSCGKFNTIIPGQEMNDIFTKPWLFQVEGFLGSLPFRHEKSLPQQNPYKFHSSKHGNEIQKIWKQCLGLVYKVIYILDLFFFPFLLPIHFSPDRPPFCFLSDKFSYLCTHLRSLPPLVWSIFYFLLSQFSVESLYGEKHSTSLLIITYFT